jgi:hypothetical protein
MGDLLFILVVIVLLIAGFSYWKNLDSNLKKEQATAAKNTSVLTGGIALTLTKDIVKAAYSFGNAGAQSVNHSHGTVVKEWNETLDKVAEENGNGSFAKASINIAHSISDEIGITYVRQEADAYVARLKVEKSKASL